MRSSRTLLAAVGASLLAASHGTLAQASAGKRRIAFLSQTARDPGALRRGYVQQ